VAREQMNTEMQEQMLGTGLVPDPNMVDPVSGNEIPLGATAEGVRDDQPAALSAGEFIIPSFAVNFYGVQQLQQLVDSAEIGLQQMEHRGLTGMPAEEEPSLGSTDRMVEPEAEPLLEAPIDVEEYYRGGLVQTYANGGLTTAAIPAPRANMVASAPVTTTQVSPVSQTVTQPLRPQRSVRDPSRSVTFPTYEQLQDIKYVKYINAAGQSILIPVIRGVPQRTIPAGFTPAPTTTDETTTPTVPVESEEDKAQKLVAAQEEQERQRVEQETALDDERRQEEDEIQENLDELLELETILNNLGELDEETDAAGKVLNLDSEAARSLIQKSLDEIKTDYTPFEQTLAAVPGIIGKGLSEGLLASNADKIWEAQGGQIPGAVKFDVGEGNKPIYIIARRPDTFFGAAGPDFQAYQQGKQIDISRVLSTLGTQYGVSDLTLDQIVTDDKGNFLRFTDDVEPTGVGRDELRESLGRGKYLGITSSGRIIVRDPERSSGTRTSRMSKRTFFALTPEQQVKAAGGIGQENIGKWQLFGGANINQKWFEGMSADQKKAYDEALAKAKQDAENGDDNGEIGPQPQPAASSLPAAVLGHDSPYMGQPAAPQPAVAPEPVAPQPVLDPRAEPQDFDFTGQEPAAPQPAAPEPVAPAKLPENLRTFLDNLRNQQRNARKIPDTTTVPAPAADAIEFAPMPVPEPLAIPAPAADAIDDSSVNRFEQVGGRPLPPAYTPTGPASNLLSSFEQVPGGFTVSSPVERVAATKPNIALIPEVPSPFERGGRTTRPYSPSFPPPIPEPPHSPSFPPPIPEPPPLPPAPASVFTPVTPVDQRPAIINKQKLATAQQDANNAAAALARQEEDARRADEEAEEEILRLEKEREDQIEAEAKAREEQIAAQYAQDYGGMAAGGLVTKKKQRTRTRKGKGLARRK